MTDRPRRILLAARHLGLLRQHYATVVDALLDEGVELIVVYESSAGAEQDEEALLAGRSGISVAGVVRTQPGIAADLTVRLRNLVDLLRFQHPDYAGSRWLEDRVFRDAPPGVERWAGPLRRLGPRAAAATIRLAVALDLLLPPWPDAQQLLDEVQPDLVVASPLVWVKSRQVDVLKAAARRGIPTAVWIPSWDNLTNKGLMRFVPDRVFVWNEMQRGELVRYHRVPADRAVITGAQTFDRWFEDEAGSPREEFCARLGLEPDRPYVLYLGSSRSIAPNEPAFFERWLAALRSSGDPVLERAGVLVRPHPRNVQAWLVAGFERFGNVSVLVPRIDDTYSKAFYDEYGDAFRHSAAVVGINTSAMVEASIFGLPVCTPVVPDVAERQHGTLHFDHLVRAGGGLLHLAPTLEEHTRQLGEFLRREPGSRDERSDRFAEAFIRPYGLDVPAAPRFVAEMLAMFSRATVVPRPGPVRRAFGALLSRTSGFVGLPLADHPLQRVLAWNVANVLVLAAVAHGLAAGALRRARKDGRRVRKRFLRLCRVAVRRGARLPGRMLARAVPSGPHPAELGAGEDERLERDRVGHAVEDSPGAGRG